MVFVTHSIPQGMQDASGNGRPGSDYVTQHIESTRALDGMQTDEWDDMKARWTYHPDDGLSLTLIDQSTS